MKECFKLIYPGGLEVFFDTFSSARDEFENNRIYPRLKCLGVWSPENDKGRRRKIL